MDFRASNPGMNSESLQLLMREDWGLALNEIPPMQQPARKPRQRPPGIRDHRDRRKRERQNRRRGRKR